MFMRDAACVFGLVLAACLPGTRPTVPAQQPLLAPTAATQTDADTLYNFYRQSDLTPKHAADGQRVLVKTRPGDCYTARSMEGRCFVLIGSNHALNQPKIIAVLTSDAGITVHGLPGPETYIEGTLRGPVGYHQAPWAQVWGNLPPIPGYMANRFVHITDARLTLPPAP